MISSLILIQLIVCSLIPWMTYLDLTFAYVMYRLWHYGMDSGRLTFFVSMLGYLILGRFGALTVLIAWGVWLVFEQISLRLLTRGTIIAHTLQAILIVSMLDVTLYHGSLLYLLNIIVVFALYIGVIRRRDTLHLLV